MRRGTGIVRGLRLLASRRRADGPAAGHRKVGAADNDPSARRVSARADARNPSNRPASETLTAPDGRDARPTGVNSSRHAKILRISSRTNSLSGSGRERRRAALVA